MVRALYAGLLWIHPPAFRRRFMPEMLWIFEQALPSTGALTLLLDAFASLARQWVLRSRAWIPVIAVLGACLQVTAGGLIWLAIQHGGRWHGNNPTPEIFPADGLGLDWLIRFIVASVGGIVFMVAAASLWMGSFVRKRAVGQRVAR